MKQTDYRAFLDRKRLRAQPTGIEQIPALSSHLFPFQQVAVAFGLRAGSWGCFFDTGLGKTRTQLEWATHAAGASNGRALLLDALLAPGGVAASLCDALDAGGPYGAGWPAPRVAVGPAKLIKTSIEAAGTSQSRGSIFVTPVFLGLGGRSGPCRPARGA